MLHLAMKAFYPEKPPFPFLHVNTTWKFKEMIKFRDEQAKKLGIEMLEYINEEGVKQGINPFDYGSAYTDISRCTRDRPPLPPRSFASGMGMPVLVIQSFSIRTSCKKKESEFYPWLKSRCAALTSGKTRFLSPLPHARTCKRYCNCSTYITYKLH